MKVFGFAGWSGSGKTTLVERLLPEFTARGLRVSVIKHAHHGFDLDKPGKDSWRHREAGATQVLMLSSDRWVLMHELRGAPEPTLDEQLLLLEPCDLVLIEGYKAAAVPKLEIHRPSHGKPPLWPESPHVVAVASDVGAEELAPDCPLPVLPINEPVTGSEDFAFFLEKVPGCYVFIGNGEGSEGGCMVHNPGYDFNDAVLPTGASYWVRLAETYLKKAG